MPETPDPVRRFRELPGAIPERLFSQIALIRRFEERLLEFFEENALFGTTH